MNNPWRQPGVAPQQAFCSSEGAEYNSITPLQGYRSECWPTPGWRQGLFIFSHIRG